MPGTLPVAKERSPTRGKETPAPHGINVLYGLTFFHINWAYEGPWILDIRQLRYFLAIIEAGSITQAAGTLNVAQPALSRHIKNMEEDLGTRLLIRNRFGVTPTEAGALLAQRARSILDDIARTKDEIRTLNADPMGVVRIGLPGTISGIVARPLIEAARERYPRIKLVIAEAMSGFIADWLGDGQVDIAVLYESSQVEGMVSELMLEEELVVIWPRDAGGASELALSDLGNVPMIVPSQAHGLRILIDAAFAPISTDLTVTVEIDSYAIIKQLVAEGYGASILPFHAVKNETEDGSLKVSRIADPPLLRRAHLVYSSTRPVTRVQEAIQSLLRDVIGELLDTGAWSAANRPERKAP